MKKCFFLFELFLHICRLTYKINSVNVTVIKNIYFKTKSFKINYLNSIIKKVRKI